ncbi:hypothetical protein GHT09_018662 [Marmota monax]|uniref:Ig-like domain-containing protein n=1 Tax=Marmota monax TaxID=9995 RepID=A0A834PZN8_MARMO|nr:hypothetical protein GHT09_018662 [Marmota monax]
MHTHSEGGDQVGNQGRLFLVGNGRPFEEGVVGRSCFSHQGPEEALEFESARPSAPMVSGPGTRATSGQMVSFTCQSHGFSPWNITLKWFKNGNELSHTQTSVHPTGESVSFNVTSTAQVTLAPGDVHSQVICEVAHVTLQGSPLRGTANLSDTVRVPPTLEVTPLPTMAWNLVNVTCQVKHFYPRSLQVTWVENGNVSRTETGSTCSENKDGTFNLTSGCWSTPLCTGRT